MKHALFGGLLATTLVSGCAGLPIATGCNVAPLVSASAQDAIAILERDWHLSHEKAEQWAAIIRKGASGVALFCAFASPVAVPGQ